jgi:NADH:ubiquinone oxidoreductase subunit E
VAERTGLPLTHVYRVATFYGAFSVVPRGRHTINVCMGTTCYVRGSDRLMEKFSTLLSVKPEETTPDMEFTLKPVRCIGCCGLAPAVAIGDSVYGKLAVKDVAGIIAQHRDGERVARAG